MPPHGPAHTGTHAFEAEPDGRLSPLAQLQVLQRRNREWERHLSAAEGAVLGAILDRTVLFQHASGFVRIEKLCELTGYSRPQVKRGLRSLRDRGLIATDRAHGRGLNVTVNLDWKPDAMAVPVPKRLKAIDHGRSIRGVIDEPSDGSPATPLIREPSQGNAPRELGLPRRRPVGAGLTASPSRPTAADASQEELFPAEDAGRGGVSPKARPGDQETPPPVARPPLPAEADATAAVQARLDALAADRKAKADKARPARLRSMNTTDWWALWRDAIEAGYPGAEMPCEWSVKQRGVLLGKA